MADRTFIVNVGIGTPPLSYQWQGVLVGQDPNVPANWQNLGTAISQVVDDAVYDWLRVNVTNAYGSKLSDPFELNPVVQTATVQFAGASTFTPGDTPSGVSVGVELITSDGNPLVNPVSVEVHDLLTGNAVPGGVDYTMATPQVLNWPAASPNGQIESATLNTSGANNSPNRNVNLDIQNPTGAALGGQTTHTVTIINIGA